MFFYELSSSSLMEINKEEFPEMQNLFQSEVTSLGKRKISKSIYYKSLVLCLQDYLIDLTPIDSIPMI